MLLAELEVWHSRPLAPTRRVALGHLVLPADPAPGFGGILLGAVIAAHVPFVAQEELGDLHRLVTQVGHGQRIVQPRFHHRYQVDRHGLARSRHRLVGDGEHLDFQFEVHGTPAQQLLGAVYATERLGHGARAVVAGVLHRAMQWRGPIGPSLITHLTGLSGSRAAAMLAYADPVAWALDVLGFDGDDRSPSKKQVMSRFRTRLREVHPDHGGAQDVASKAIGDLGEARRILLEQR